MLEKHEARPSKIIIQSSNKSVWLRLSEQSDLIFVLPDSVDNECNEASQAEG